MLLSDIVSHEEFVLTKNVTELRKNMVKIIQTITGVQIDIVKNFKLSSIVKALSMKFNSRKVRKEKFLHLEHTWLSSKTIEVTISSVRS